MGVPSFYRWLADKYPKIVVNVVEKTEEHDGTLPNPNGYEFDNLYLDMNGIIHPCFHPEHTDPLFKHFNTPATYEEVFSNIFEYIDRVFMIVRPRKLLYLAIDGVAPRAKMNQQRTRRFRTSKDNEILSKEEDRLRKQYQNEGRDVLPTQESEVSDSNIITPGTKFMYELSSQLEKYIHMRISKNSAWKKLKVILSDANAPGEGEHKIMSFIRLQRSCPGYDPNTSHVLYGLDADLIMLALATHEVHFSILRENVLVENNPRTSHSASSSFLAERSEVNVVKCRGWFKQFDLNMDLKDTTKEMSSLEISGVSKQKSLAMKPHQFLHVWILREYLNLDLRTENRPEKFEYDIERLIDDFIFICFFGGNDFLPHMPTLEIHEGAIDLLIHVYKQEFKNLGGYLVNTEKVDDKKGGYIKLKRVEKFIHAVGAFEDQIFQKRSAIRESKLRRMLSDIEEESGKEEEALFPVISIHNPKSSSLSSEVHSQNIGKSPDNKVQILENTKALKEQLKSFNRETSDVFKNGLMKDMVKLGAPGWKKRYYKHKFSAETDADMENTRKIVVEKYTEGLCWVLLYYFSGVPSWTWFFPYHYGPFASDFKGLSSTKVIFQRGMPFKPFDQLMAVLPPTSAGALPPSYGSLMTADDSSILDFYPNDFDVDTDGKRFLWQGICKLPFIEEERLLSATKKVENELCEEESIRNAQRAGKLFVHVSENLALQIISTFNDAGSTKQEKAMKIDTGLSGDINGFVHPKLEPNNVSDSNGLASHFDVLCVNYEPPCFFLHIPRVLEGTIFPDQVVSESDIDEVHLWHESHGYPSRSNRSYGQVQERNPSVGASGWNPRGRGQVHDVVRGASSGWNPRGRGQIHDVVRGASGGWNPRGRGQIHDVVRGASWNPRGRGQIHDGVRAATHIPYVDAGGSWCPRGRGRARDVVEDWSPRGSGRAHNVVEGWIPRGSGRAHDVAFSSQSVSHHDGTRLLNEQTKGPSWWDTYGRGARGNENGNYQFTNYHARQNNVNGQFRSVSGSNSNQGRGQLGDTKGGW